MTNQQPQMPNAYKKALAAKQFFQTERCLESALLWPDSIGDAIARAGFILGCGLSVGCIASLFKGLSILALLPVALVVILCAVAMLRVAGNPGERLYFALGLLAFFAAVVGGVL